jgi:hypothetical protein
MKFTIQAHAKEWCPPEKVHFDEGLKLPLNAVDSIVVEWLIEKWLDAVCKAAGIEYEFRISRHKRADY